MGSVCAMSATERLTEVLEKLFLKAAKKQYVGRRIEDVSIGCDDCYNITLVFKLSDGSFVDGMKVAEYIEDCEDDGVDGCVIHDDTMDIEEIKAEYRRRGWEEHIPEDDSNDGSEDPREDE